MMLEQALIQLNKCEHPTAKEVLRAIVRLHSITVVKQNLGWYLTNGVISPEGAQELAGAWDMAVKDLTPHLNTIIDSWAILSHRNLLPPINRDYLGFMDQPDHKNYDAAGEAFDFRTTGVMRAKM